MFGKPRYPCHELLNGKVGVYEVGWMVVVKKGLSDSRADTSTLRGSGADDVGVNLNFAKCLCHCQHACCSSLELWVDRLRNIPRPSSVEQCRFLTDPYTGDPQVIAFAPYRLWSLKGAGKDTELVIRADGRVGVPDDLDISPASCMLAGLGF